MKDYYKILEVNKDASPEIIAKVYKVLAKKYHPDLQDETNKVEAAEKFKEISEAYEILSNDEKRREYNQQLESLENQNSVNINDYNALRNYCVQLENEVNELKNLYNNDASFSQYNNEQQVYNETVNNAQQEAYTNAVNNAQQEAYTDAVNKAYHDAYVNNLKNMGYKVKYQKTFKDSLKDLLSFIITIIIVYIALKFFGVFLF